MSKNTLAEGYPDGPTWEMIKKISEMAREVYVAGDYPAVAIVNDAYSRLTEVVTPFGSISLWHTPWCPMGRVYVGSRKLKTHMQGIGLL